MNQLQIIIWAKFQILIPQDHTLHQKSLRMHRDEDFVDNGATLGKLGAALQCLINVGTAPR